MAADLKKIIEKERILNPFEQALKKMYKKYPEKHPDVPGSSSAYRDLVNEAADLAGVRELVPKLLEKQLHEEDFFQPGTDVELYRHFRYLPAFRHSHDFIEIICVFTGKCRNFILDSELEMVPGDICILAPATEHALSAFSDDAVIFNIELRTSTFEKAFFGILGEDDVLSVFFSNILYHNSRHPYLLFRTDGDEDVFNFVLYAFMEIQYDRAYRNRMVNSVITAFFIELLRSYGSRVQIPKTRPADSENVVYMLRYMQENYKTVTLSSLASFFGYSERQVLRILKNSTGMSFRENIQNIRMKHAGRMLAYRDVSIQKIASELGYQDAGSFRRIFQKYYGMTPAQYRDRLSGRADRK